MGRMTTTDNDPLDDRALPPGTHATFLGITAVGFVALLVFVFAYGVHGERLTAGVDTTCARATFVAAQKMAERGNHDQALALFRRALEGHFQSEERQYMYGRSIGELCFRLGRYDDAIEAYRQLPPVAFERAGTLAGYVGALFRAGEFDETERLGAVWLEKAEAQQDLQQLVWAHHSLGVLYHETLRPEMALPHFRALRDIDPTNPANLEVAHVLRQNGLYDEALAQLDALLAGAPQGHLHKQATDLRAEIAAAAAQTE